MRIGLEDVNRHVVVIKSATRDEKTKKIVYGTIQSINVFDSTDKEVVDTVIKGLTSASNVKK